MKKKYGEAACEAKQPRVREGGRSSTTPPERSRPPRLIAKSISARKICLDPRYSLQNTEAAKKAIYEIGGNYQAIAVYDEAASWYERYARGTRARRRSPRLSRTRSFSASVSARKTRRSRTPTSSTRTTAPPSRRRRPQIAFAIGAHYIEKEDWGEARKRLTSAMSQIDKNATVDVQIQAHAMLGRVFINLNSASNASSEYNKVRGLWKDPAAVVKKIQETGDDRKVGKALTAVGEALFFFAEQQTQGGR